MFTRFKHDSNEIPLQMNDVLFISFSKNEKLSMIYLESTSQMDENQKKHGNENSYFIMNFQKEWMNSVHSDISFSGDEISTVHTMRLISLVQKKMLVR